MNTSPSSVDNALVPESSHCEEHVDFVRWALAQLGISYAEDADGARFSLDEADREVFEGQSELRLAWRSAPTGSSWEPIDVQSRFGHWLLEKLRSAGPAVPTQPRFQPAAVNDVASKLLAAYRVDGGQVHLGGCQLEDFPFLRLSFAASEKGRPSVRHVFVAHDGSSVSDDLALNLGLLELEPIHKSQPRIDHITINTLLAAGRRIAAKKSSVRDPSATVAEPLVAAIVWVKHVSGKLLFTVGGTTIEHPFSGWAKLIEAQPYVSKTSGASSFHLGATDDGRIDAVDQIVPCECSGRRVLVQELVTCCVTGRHVLEEFTELCPVSGRPALSDEFAICPMCRQRVSQSVWQEKGCDACRQLTKIRANDPRLAWILGEHKGLDRWRRWRLAETQQAYIAQSERLMKRLLIVVDKESLTIRHLATSGKWASLWTPATGTARDELLR